MRRFESLSLGFALALFVVGLALYPLTRATFTRTLAQRYSLAEQAGLSRGRMLEVAEQVRAFVADPEGQSLPETVDGRPGFDAAAVSHLLDVRNVLSGAQIFTGLLAAGIAVWLALLVVRRRIDRISSAMKAGAWLCAAFVGLALIAGLFDFERLFSAFHALFFAQGTWTFPQDSLLIETFPEAFWTVAGLAWGALVLVGGAMLALMARMLRSAPAAEMPRGENPLAGLDA